MNYSEIVRASSVRDVARQHTHSLYRYPASMSPAIAKTVITRFTKLGDTIFDPFCGGGTTAVEALASGRKAICSDISELACFITRAKAQPMRRHHIKDLREWLEHLGDPASTLKSYIPEPIITSRGKKYSPRSYGLLRAISRRVSKLEYTCARTAARLIVLRTGQIAFDSREMGISPAILSRIFRRAAAEFLNKHSDYSRECERIKPSLAGQRRLTVLGGDAEHVLSRMQERLNRCSLILTSPPYPGVHVLYHRWQIRGRKEVALPFDLLGLRDGHCEAHYTLAPRTEPSNKGYFDRITRIFSAINCAVRSGTPIVQVVAFARPERQLEQYLEAMQGAGLDAGMGSKTASKVAEREVPNGRWYVRTDSMSSGRKEFVLVHHATGRSRDPVDRIPKREV